MATISKQYLLALVLLLLFGPQAKAMPSAVITQPVSVAQNDSVPLPFNEGWDQGTFAFNNWVHSGNWSISVPTGNPFPSATYSGLPAKANYNDTLQSILLSASEYTCATIYLDFDFMLVDQNHTGAEFLTVEVRTDSVWKKIAERSNSGDVGWTSQHVEIAHAKGRSFTIRFRAHGANSADILHWYVDNIHAYAVCRPPLNLTVNQSQYQVILSWTPPDCSYDGPIPQWIHWDDGVNFSSIGTCNCEADLAAHWTPGQLTHFSGCSVTKISFFPNSAGNATYRARVWQGVNGTNMIVDQDIPSVTWDQWNIVDLVSPALIDVTQDLYVGVFIHFLSGFPAGTDAGPAIDGYGNMMYWVNEWVTLLALCPSCDYNWNLQAYVENLKSASRPVILPQPPTPEQSGPVTAAEHKSGNGIRFLPREYPVRPKNNSSLMGYNVWRTNSTGDTSTFHKINGPLVADTTYTDIIANDNLGVFQYYVTAVINDSATNTFLCESPGTNRLTVSIPAVGISSNLPGGITVFPNPSADIINVSSDLTINSVAILNFTGREVYSKNNVNSKTAHLNISALPASIYFVKVTQDMGTGISKITVIR
ncbi:MAG: T9SS type A sorting domain-containing protein [Bacteroidota bacterium]|jgi:Secretion system C-terminal sorting domain